MSAAIRTLTRNEAPAGWVRAAWPALALAVAGMLEQSTRRPSLAYLLLNACC